MHTWKGVNTMLVQGQLGEEGEMAELLKVKCIVDGIWWSLVNDLEPHVVFVVFSLVNKCCLPLSFLC